MKLFKILSATIILASLAFSQSATNNFETELLAHVFQNAASDSIGDVTGLRGSTAADSMYVALFTASPTETGEFTNEANYTGYSRKGIVRSATGWTVTSDTVSNAAIVTFPEATGGTNTITYFGVTTYRNSNKMLFYGQLGGSLSVSSGVQPQFAIGALKVSLN